MTNLKIAFFSENNHLGEIPESLYSNLRTDLAWQYLLKAEHYPLHRVDSLEGHTYDIGIIIPPKDKVSLVNSVIDCIRRNVKKLAFMQEGPVDYWTGYSIVDQINYLSLLSKSDFLLCHNRSDMLYYTGLFNKETYVMPSVMVEDFIPDVVEPMSEDVIVGGNICKWYNGMVSLVVAKEYASGDVYFPSMGRKQTDESSIEGIKHLPYCQWQDWMKQLSRFKIGVHMMPTVAAGTFSLNCAYWGIPCIGNKQLDTQNYLHPDLSVDINDVWSATRLAKSLRDDLEFYTYCSSTCKRLYQKHYASQKFVEKMNSIFLAVMNK